MKKIILFSVSLFLVVNSFGQNIDSLFIRKIFNEGLLNGKAYSTLDTFCMQCGKRNSGSAGASRAVNFTKARLKGFGADTTWLVPCTVPHWVHEDTSSRCVVLFSKNKMTQQLTFCALGNSIGTAAGGITAHVIAVDSIRQLKMIGKDKIKGNIIFFKRPFDATLINTFDAYEKAVDQRAFGPAQASKYGAVAVIVRSMSTGMDDAPHTGSTIYNDSFPKIPGVALGVQSAAKLLEDLKNDPDLSVHLEMNCKMLPDTNSNNVIGELRGTEKPNEVISFGGHLDDWETGNGAQDDGAGVMHSMEALRILKAIGYKPKHTIRVTLWMNEENGARGAKAYAAWEKNTNEKVLAAFESDAGGFTPRGFSFDTNDTIFNELLKFKSLLENFECGELRNDHESGTDAEKLKGQTKLLGGLDPDSQRYFDLHHSRNDIIQNVNPRELELGACSIAALVYLIDKYNIGE
jgi:carboxypeptidase Q